MRSRSRCWRSRCTSSSKEASSWRGFCSARNARTRSSPRHPDAIRCGMSPVIETGTAAAAGPGAPAGAARSGPTLFGHPRGLATLFFTEMWERFTYYGIQSILILFLVAARGRGGLGFSDESASAIWGLYRGATYLLSLLGGWVADRLTGGRLAIASGGVLIAAGNVLLASGGTRL